MRSPLRATAEAVNLWGAPTLTASALSAVGDADDMSIIAERRLSSPSVSSAGRPDSSALSALSSIAAVSQVELITKTKEQTFGTRYRINGGKEVDLEDTGARDGTTFLIQQLFYNVPARRKFLKTPMTEASHVGDLMTRLALSHPEISFQFINNGQSRLHSSGNGKLRDVIYHVYGRDIASNLLKVNASAEDTGIKITGFLGKPVISRGNRN